MDQEERWNQFAASGRVMDYLKYKEGVESSGKNQTNGSSERMSESVMTNFADNMHFLEKSK